MNQTIDGVNQWTAISLNTSSPRNQIVYNIDDETVPARLNTDDKKTTFQVKIKSNKILFQSFIRSKWIIQRQKYSIE